MCGIAGILELDPKRSVDRSSLDRMVASIAHRGPDDLGTYVRGPVGLGHRRLSVIDLAGGHQPMIDEDRSRALVYNGEVYNFREIRSRLVRDGLEFGTDSDTEVLLKLAESDDLRWLHQLNGMFALALWDDRAQSLLLARDRVGIKPLYYACNGSQFVFASELKALLQHPSVSPELNHDAIEEYIAFRCRGRNETLLRGVQLLPAGHTLLIRRNEMPPSPTMFWNDLPEVAPKPSTSDPVGEFEALFTDAVRLRLVSDVPVGTYNSGGVDSSLVTATVRDITEGELHTFSVGFDDPAFDETRYAQIVANQLGTEHHTLVVSAKDYAQSLPEAIWQCEEPLAHAHTVQLIKLSRFAKEFVTVVLTGEGADETLAGYPRYQIPLIAQTLSRAPGPVLSALAATADRLRLRRVSKLLEICGDVERSVIENARVCPVGDLDAIGYSGRHYPSREEEYDRISASPLSLLEQVLHFDRKTYLPTLLNRLDKTTMASGVEARVPFLDHRLVEWSRTVPQRDKLLVWRENKLLLKRLAVKRFPREMIYRRKMGFGVPVGNWFRDPHALGPYLDLITDDTFRQRGYCDPDAVATLVDQHRKGGHDHGQILWSLLNVELWIRQFIESAANVPPDPTVVDA